MSDFSGKRKLSINLSLFIGLSETFSSYDNNHHTSKSPTSNKSQRIFEGGVVGLGIVAAMDEMSDTHDSILSNKQLSISPKSQPIPIVFSKPLPKKLREPTLEKDEIELSESYTCVISHLGDNNSVKKIEYFHGEPGCMNGNLWVSSGVFFTEPPKYLEAESMFHAPDFLSTCYLCKKKLNGLDIFMYRGEKGFCSAECRCRQIKKDEQKHRRENGSVKPFDYSVSPCSAPRFIVAGVAAA